MGIDIQTHFNIYDTLVNINRLDVRIIHRDVSQLGGFRWNIIYVVCHLNELLIEFSLCFYLHNLVST